MVMWHGTDPDELFRLLPFKDEPISAIRLDSDIVIFCGPFPEWGKWVPYDYDIILFSFLSHVESFVTEISDDIEETEQFLCILKYSFALQQVVSNLSSEDMINVVHFPYLQESLSDLSGSLLLAAKGYNKQSQILLRPSLEAAVAHFYYTAKRIDYDSLEKGADLRLRAFRSYKGGMISYLLENGYIDRDIFDQLNESYGKLNGYVHSNLNNIDNFMPGVKMDEKEKLFNWKANASLVTESLIRLVISMLKNDIH